MYLNNTSVQNRKPKQCVNSLNHHQNRMLIIPVAPFFSGVWCHTMCCKISALKELYFLIFFLNVWRFKKMTFFQSFMSILWALMWVNVEIRKKKTKNTGLIGKCSQSEKKLWKGPYWLLRDLLEEDVFEYNLGHGLRSSWLWLLYSCLVFKANQMCFFSISVGFYWIV